MMRRFIILVFILTVASNSLAAVSPHMEGDGGCEAECCRTARQNRAASPSARLCCLIDCNQPGGMQATSPARSILDEQSNKCGATRMGFKLEPIAALAAATRGYSLTQPPAEPTSLYLKTGALLI